MPHSRIYPAAAVATHLCSRVAAIAMRPIALDVCGATLFHQDLTEEQFAGVAEAADWIGNWVLEHLELPDDELQAVHLVQGVRAYYEDSRTALCPPLIEELMKLVNSAADASVAA